MMPDLNSVPPSPHSLAARRRSAHQPMAPPPLPPSPSLNILPSNQPAVGSHSRSRSRATSSVPSPQLAAAQALQPQPPAPADAAVGPGPGPLRHPRPLTASELHMQLEKEQEAVASRPHPLSRRRPSNPVQVNRLTRELSLLRAAQNASVVSNASSTSATASAHEPVPDPSLLSGAGFSIPTARRHHRNSSTASQTLASSYEARWRPPPPLPLPLPLPLSRQDSSASRRSQTNSPGPQASSIDPSSYFHQQRVPIPASVSVSSVAATPGSANLPDQMSPGLMPATSRYEETAFYRHELEMAKKENEALKRRIRELERMVQSRRATDAGRTIEAASSTSAAVPSSPSTAGPRDADGPRRDRQRGMTSQSVTSLGVGVPEDEVKVGESAASSGLDKP